MKTVLVRIEGKVQGVWYRGWTVDNARELGLNGWVRNRHDGSVEAIFSGGDEIVDEMLRRCKKGPELAKVSSISRSQCEAPEKVGFYKLETV